MNLADDYELEEEYRIDRQNVTKCIVYRCVSDFIIWIPFIKNY